MATLIVLFAVKMLDPIVALAGIIPYFAIRDDWRVSLLVAACLGLVFAALTAAFLGMSPAGVYVAPFAACAWWAIFLFGRRALNPVDSQ